MLMATTAIAAPKKATTSDESLASFALRPISENDYALFVKVFGEMRGPLRAQIIKDRGDLKTADALAYLMRIKNDRGVRTALKESKITWAPFIGLTGNIVIAYMSIQPQATKAEMLRRLSSYGMTLATTSVPPEYQKSIEQALASDQGAAIANMALEFAIQIPPENIALAKRHEKDLDRFFYTKHWRNALTPEAAKGPEQTK